MTIPVSRNGKPHSMVGTEVLHNLKLRAWTEGVPMAILGTLDCCDRDATSADFLAGSGVYSRPGFPANKPVDSLIFPTRLKEASNVCGLTVREIQS